jgi:S1-C subfamily serine protease
MRPPEDVSTSQSEQTDTDLGDFPDEFDTPEQQSEAQSPPIEGEASAVYDAVIDSVAGIQVLTPRGPAGGTAWVYDGDHLVTNDHVVADTTDQYVRFVDVGWREASIVGTDRYSDLAVIEVEDKPEGATALPVVEDPKAVGTPVAAVGNPFNLTGSFTTGVISGRERNIPIPGSNFRIADGIQTDAALNPGNSGGPLVTYDGNVAGVVSAGQGDNIGFAISAAMIQRIVPELIEDGEFAHSHMGVRLMNVRPMHIEANDLPVSWGVYIHRVLEDGPSDGILQGTTDESVVDGRQVLVGGDVVTRMEDWTIHDQERLSAFLALETDPGDTIEVEIVRDGEYETVNLTLGTRPEPR